MNGRDELDAFRLRLLKRTDLTRAINEARTAFRAGYLDDDVAERAHIEAVRQYEWEPFSRGRRDALKYYEDANAKAVVALYMATDYEDAESRLRVLIPALSETMKADGQLRAFCWSFQHPDGLLARERQRLIALLEESGVPQPREVTRALTSFAPSPSFAAHEVLTLLPILLRCLKEDVPNDVVQISAMLDDEARWPYPSSILRDVALRDFGRSSSAVLASRISALMSASLPSPLIEGKISNVRRNLLELMAEKLQAQTMIDSRLDAITRATVDELLHRVRQLLEWEHIDDSLRGAVFDGIEDYWIRNEVARNLYLLGRLQTPRAFELPQHEGLLKSAFKWINKDSRSER